MGAVTARCHPLVLHPSGSHWLTACGVMKVTVTVIVSIVRLGSCRCSVLCGKFSRQAGSSSRQHRAIQCHPTMTDDDERNKDDNNNHSSVLLLPSPLDTSHMWFLPVGRSIHTFAHSGAVVDNERRDFLFFSHGCVWWWLLLGCLGVGF